MNKRQLATKIWDAANKMRSKIEANEYKDYILGFIFYKYLSDREERYLRAQGYPEAEWSTLVTEEDPETVRDLELSLGYFIPYPSLFSVWIAAGHDFDVSHVRDALSSFTRHLYHTHKSLFEGVFDTLQMGLSKLGDTAASQTKAISSLIHLIDDIPMDGRADYDVLGFIYEYLISRFAANAGKKAGEFYTPHEVSLLMSELVAHHLQQRPEISIYDPTSGSGSLLINIGRAVSKYIDPARVSYFAQELKANTYNLTRMNLVMRGINPGNIAVRNADTLEEDWPLEDAGFAPLAVDAVVSNPPYSQNWDPSDKETDPRYAEFGLAPKSKADYAFLLHDLYHLKSDGIMCIVLPHGVLFRGGDEAQIRRRLLEKNHIHAVIGLPANIFFGTGIPTIIIVLRRERAERDVLIVDASRGFVKEGKSNRLRACDIRRIIDVVTERQEVEKFSRLVSPEEIERNEYNLNIPRYVDSADPAESRDVYAEMFGGIPAAEAEELHAYWAALPGLREHLFRPAEHGYFALNAENVREAVGAHPAVEAFRRQFAAAFAGLGEQMRAELVDRAEDVEIAPAEERLSADVLGRAAGLPLVDRYAVYQLFAEAWVTIASDLETIRTEGLASAARQVDPLFVTKKQGGREAEVQDGWVGRLFPFELVQRCLMAEELQALSAVEERLSAVSAELESLAEELEDEEKRDLMNEAQDAFVPKSVAEQLKNLRRPATEEERTALQHARRADALLKEEKACKATLKKQSADLLARTKQAIESLPEERIPELLAEKWIAPPLAALEAMPQAIIAELGAKVQALADKYATTFTALEADIAATERELAGMLGELTGNEADLAAIRELQRLLKGDR
ncbi:MAG: type I restriction-modification system subunit M [Akkermansia muciniphila]